MSVKATPKKGSGQKKKKSTNASSKSKSKSKPRNSKKEQDIYNEDNRVVVNNEVTCQKIDSELLKNI